jgi:uncharacterized protein with PQ loop repeat
MLAQFWIDLIGYVGSSAVAVSAPLQLRKSWKSESTGDISWKWISSYLFGICLIFIYAIIEDLPPVWGPILLEITSSFMLLMLKVKYDLIQHKTYAVEMSTQTDPEDFAETCQSDKLEIGFNGTTSNGSELEKYMQVSSSDGKMV